MEREDIKTGRCQQCRIEHQRGVIRESLENLKAEAVAIEAIGNWYWIVDEIEAAGKKPLLVHPRKAKLMMGLTNKTDRLDVHGLNQLQRNKTLPTVWIAPSKTRDLRELTRVRMVLSRQRTLIKNRITATLSKYALKVEGYADAYGVKARAELLQKIDELPEQTRWAAGMLLQQLDFICAQIGEQETRLEELVKLQPCMQQLMSLPGVGFILAAVIWLEIGDIQRFATAEKLASYSGTTPKVHASGGKVRYGRLRVDVNHYLKWAFSEAANSVAIQSRRHCQRHVSKLYIRIRSKKGHPKAIGAVARHLAEAAFWILTKNENYKDPILGSLRKV